jgi:hypothetical protein
VPYSSADERYAKKTEVDTELNKIKRFDVDDGNLVSDNLFNKNGVTIKNSYTIHNDGTVVNDNGYAVTYLNINLDANTTYTTNSNATVVACYSNDGFIGLCSI